MPSRPCFEVFQQRALHRVPKRLDHFVGDGWTRHGAQIDGGNQVPAEPPGRFDGARQRRAFAGRLDQFLPALDFKVFATCPALQERVRFVVETRNQHPLHGRLAWNGAASGPHGQRLLAFGRLFQGGNGLSDDRDAHGERLY